MTAQRSTTTPEIRLIRDLTSVPRTLLSVAVALAETGPADPGPVHTTGQSPVGSSPRSKASQVSRLPRRVVPSAGAGPDGVDAVAPGSRAPRS
jgi:hypothetical protein